MFNRRALFHVTEKKRFGLFFPHVMQYTCTISTLERKLLSKKSMLNRLTEVAGEGTLLSITV